MHMPTLGLLPWLLVAAIAQDRRPCVGVVTDAAGVEMAASDERIDVRSK